MSSFSCTIFAVTSWVLSMTSSLKVCPVNVAARWKKSFCSLEKRTASRASRGLSWISGVFSMTDLAGVESRLVCAPFVRAQRMRCPDRTSCHEVAKRPSQASRFLRGFQQPDLQVLAPWTVCRSPDITQSTGFLNSPPMATNPQGPPWASQLNPMCAMPAWWSRNRRWMG